MTSPASRPVHRACRRATASDCAAFRQGRALRRRSRAQLSSRAATVWLPACPGRPSGTLRVCFAGPTPAGDHGPHPPHRRRSGLIPEQVRQAFADPGLPRDRRRERQRPASPGARADPPDVILLDLRLPDRSGLEVYQEIRAIDARIPVIFVTMAKTADTAIEAMKQGAFDYLYKPLDLLQPAPRRRRGARGRRRMRSPVKLAESDDRRGHRRRHLRQLPGDARDLQGDRPRRGAGRHRPHHRRERHRQGAGGARDLPAQRARQGALPRAQLRGHPRRAARERALRPREGRLHRRRPPAHRQVRAVQRRHALPRRDRRHAAGAAGEDPARPAGADLRARRRQRDRPDRRARHRRDEPRPRARSPPRTSSGATSTTA